jgi:hypothetical protein
MYREKPTQILTPLYEVQKAVMLSHKVKNKNTNPNLRCNDRRNGDKIDTPVFLQDHIIVIRM